MFLDPRRLNTDSETVLARRLSLVAGIAILGALAVSPQAHAEIISAPAVISDVYSDVNMRVQLATTKDINKPCTVEECVLNKEFDQQVQSIGTRLSKVAFEAYPDLSKRIGRFNFVVAEKKGAGTTSNAAGTVVIFRGVQDLYLEEQALAFVIAREMGRVIGRHHDENTGTSILLSVLVGVLFPAANILHGINGSAAVANATSSTTLTTTAATTAASSATSFVGSKMVLAGIKPKQLREADVIAMRLLKPLEWSESDIASSLEACTQIDGEDAWEKDFRFSTAHVRTLVPEEVMTASAEPKAESPHVQLAPQLKPSEVALRVPEENTRLKDVAIVAKNEAGITSDAVVVSALTVPQVAAAELPGITSEEQKVTIDDEVTDTLTEEPQLSDVVGHPIVKASARSVAMKKPVLRTAPKRNVGMLAFKKAPNKLSRTASRNSRLNVAKAAVGGKQTSGKRLYANKAARTKVALNDVRKNKQMRISGSVRPVSLKSASAKPVSTKPKLNKIVQTKAMPIKIE